MPMSSSALTAKPVEDATHADDEHTPRTEPTSSTPVKLCATSPAFLPAYVNPPPASTLRKEAKPFVPAKSSGQSSFLAEELDMNPRQRLPFGQKSALTSICNQLVDHGWAWSDRARSSEQAAVVNSRTNKQSNKQSSELLNDQSNEPSNEPDET